MKDFRNIITTFLKKTLKVILCCFLVGFSIFSSAGCSNNKEYVYGDFTYTKASNGKTVRISGLSEEGKTKEQIIIPDTIDGLEVESLRFGYYGVNPNKWASNNLKKMYFLNSKSIYKDPFIECSNLQQYLIVNVSENDIDFLNDIKSQKRPNNEVKAYIFKDAYIYFSSMVEGNVDEDKRFIKPANVTYYYNYFDAENGGCYWIDNVEIGEKITFIPNDPIRIVDGKEVKTFVGWFTEKECIYKWDFEKGVMPESGEINLYAKWL